MRAGASLNATAGRAVYKRAGARGPCASVRWSARTQNSRQEGGKAMAIRIRRAGVAAALALVLMATALPGVAHAKIISGTPDNDYLLGTIKNDLIRGRGGDDYIRALAGDDLLRGGAGEEVVRGGGGNDKIYARDTDSLDTIDCGGGFDKVETIHRDDRTLDNCERTLGPRRGNI